MTDQVQFTPDSNKPPEYASEKARNEQAAFFQEPERKPNSIVIKLWKDGHLTFEPDSGVQIFAILALVLLSLTVVAVSAIGIWTSADATWPEKAMTSIGNAISAIVGAMVGSAVTSRVNKRR
jgi:hypothetical protein